MVGWALAVVAAMAQAQQWYTANQLTFGWDAARLEDGSAVPAGEPIEYCLYRVDSAAPKTAAVELGCGIDGQSAVVTLGTEGRFFLGVKAQRFDAAHQLIGESAIAWSDDPEAAAGGAVFGAQHFLAPAPPQGLKVQ